MHEYDPTLLVLGWITAKRCADAQRSDIPTASE